MKTAAASGVDLPQLLKVTAPTATPSEANKHSTSRPRDLRIDVLRGFALLMIFIDHTPNNELGSYTLRNFGFCDAAELFVFLAGYSSSLAYTRSFTDHGFGKTVVLISRRTGRIYVFQIGLLLITVATAFVWDRYYDVQPTLYASILNAPIAGLIRGSLLSAVPTYLDILPLYVVLLTIFPLIFVIMRKSLLLVLALSGVVWLAVGLDHSLNLPNWTNGQGWYFDPFAWQFLFTIGAVAATAILARNGKLPFRWWMAVPCAVYLGMAFLLSAPWTDWHLPDLRPFAMDQPDKTYLTWPRIVDILALLYLLLSSPAIDVLARQRVLSVFAACGRHSLEVFSLGILLALMGRLMFRRFGTDFEVQFIVNVVGIGSQCLMGVWLERRRKRAIKTTSFRSAQSTLNGSRM